MPFGKPTEPETRREDLAVCERCGKTSAESYVDEIWEHQMCATCFGEWEQAPEVVEAHRLDPVPLWRRQRMVAAGEPVPPRPTHEQTCAAYRKATAAWLARTRKTPTTRVHTAADTSGVA